ncbi:MAG: hypothetical protein IJI57_10030 [Flexilinea sp.]|nr:hypothetical protein [Flexilinea sp.]
MLQKTKSFFTGKRSFSKRLVLSAGPSFVLSFMLFFFGPLDLAYVSRDDITYSPLEIVPVTALIMLISFLVLLLAAAIPGGKIHAGLVSAYTGFGIALYVQGAFLNPDLGTLDGHSIEWTSLSTRMLLNLVLWFFIVLIPYLIHYFSNRSWRRFVSMVSMILILMQAVSLSTKLIDQMRIDSENADNYLFSKENMFHLGKEKNVVIFLLDTVSNKDIEQITDAYPDILYQFRDFTRFDNANTRFMYTVPSVLEILTTFDPDDPVFDLYDHIDRAWKNPKADAFYSALKEAGFQTNLYVSKNYITNNLGELRPYLSNIFEYSDDIEINRTALLNLYKLSLFRYLPIAAKPFFVIYTDDINQIITNPKAYANQWDFVKQVYNTDLETGPEENVFSFYYLQGTHRPYTLNERGEITGDYSKLNVTNMVDQGAGFLNLVGHYLWRMKTLDIYDDALIIILADHGSTAGNYFYDPQPIFWIKPPHQQQDSMLITHAPITTQTQMLPTIAEILGFTNFDYGDTVFDIEDEPVERWTRIYGFNSDYPATGTNEPSNVVYEYHYTGDGNDLIEAFRGEDMVIYPMTKGLIYMLEEHWNNEQE